MSPCGRVICALIITGAFSLAFAGDDSGASIPNGPQRLQDPFAERGEVRNPDGDYSPSITTGNAVVSLDGILSISASSYAGVHTPDAFSGLSAASTDAYAGISFDANLLSTGDSLNLFTVKLQAYSGVSDVLESLFANCASPTAGAGAALVFNGTLLKGVPELLKTRYGGNTDLGAYITTHSNDDSYLELGKSYSVPLLSPIVVSNICHEISQFNRGTFNFSFDAKEFVLLEFKASEALKAYLEQYSFYLHSIQQQTGDRTAFLSGAKSSLQEWRALKAKLAPMANSAFGTSNDTSFRVISSIMFETEETLKQFEAALDNDTANNEDISNLVRIIGYETKNFETAVSTLSHVFNYDTALPHRLKLLTLHNERPLVMFKCGPDFVKTVKFPIYEWSASETSNSGSATGAVGASGDVVIGVRNITCGISTRAPPTLDAQVRADIEVGSSGYFGLRGDAQTQSQNYISLKIDGVDTPVTKPFFLSDRERTFIRDLNRAESSRIEERIIDPLKNQLTRLSDLADSFTNAAFSRNDPCDVASVVLGSGNELTKACFLARRPRREAVQEVSCPQLPQCPGCSARHIGDFLNPRTILNCSARDACRLANQAAQGQCDAARAATRAAAEAAAAANNEIDRGLVLVGGRGLVNLHRAVRQKVNASFNFDAISRQLAAAALNGEANAKYIDTHIIGPINEIARRLNMGYQLSGSGRIAFNSHINLVQFHPRINTRVSFMCQNHRIALSATTQLDSYRDGQLGGFSALGFKFEFQINARLGDKVIFNWTGTPINGALPEVASQPISRLSFPSIPPINIDLGFSC